jgi:hypothetical protein
MTYHMTYHMPYQLHSCSCLSNANVHCSRATSACSLVQVSINTFVSGFSFAEMSKGQSVKTEPVSPLPPRTSRSRSRSHSPVPAPRYTNYYTSDSDYHEGKGYLESDKGGKAGKGAASSHEGKGHMEWEKGKEGPGKEKGKEGPGKASGSADDHCRNQLLDLSAALKDKIDEMVEGALDKNSFVQENLLDDFKSVRSILMPNEYGGTHKDKTPVVAKISLMFKMKSADVRDGDVAVTMDKASLIVRSLPV